MNVTITRSGTPPKVVAERLPRAIKAGVSEVTRVGHQIAAARIMRIYMRRIPTFDEDRRFWAGGKVLGLRTVKSRARFRRRSLNGQKPMWRRSGELRKSLWSATKSGPGWSSAKASHGGWTTTGVISHNRGIRGEVYGNHMLLGKGRSRHGLVSGGSDSWTPGRPAAGVWRKNPWFQETAERLEPQIIRQFDKGFQRRMDG